MKVFIKICKLTSAILGSLLLLSGCHIGYPFQGPGYDRQKGALANDNEALVYLAVTHGTIGDGKKSDFTDSLQMVREKLKTTPGLIGYSVRKELFGDEVWTMSAWTSPKALEQFLAEKAHRSAATHGGIAPVDVRSAYTWVASDSLPVSWDEALLLLDEQH